MKRAGALALLVLIGLTCFAGCGEESVEVSLLDGCLGSPPAAGQDCPPPPCTGASFRDSAKYVDLLVVKNGCPTDADLSVGKVDNVVFRGVAGVDDPLPEIGNLEKTKFGFVVLLRDDQCRIKAFGCTEADLDKIRKIRIAVRDWTGLSRGNDICRTLDGPGCSAPEACVNGLCQLPGDGGGGNCTLRVVSSGSLEPPLDPTGVVAGPGVAATNSGFVIGYREQSADMMQNFATVFPLGDNGKGTSETLDLGTCMVKIPDDGVAVAPNGDGSKALLMMSDNCSAAGAGALFAPIAANGTVNPADFVPARNSTFVEFQMPKNHGAGPAPGGWESAYKLTTTGVDPVQRVHQVGQGPPVAFGSGVQTLYQGTESASMVALSTTVRGVLGRNSGDYELQISDPSGAPSPPIATLPLSGSMAAAWTSITAWDAASEGRVAVIYPGASGITLRVANRSGTELANLTLGTGSFVGGDVVSLGDNLLVAGTTASGITMYRLSGAQGSISTAPADTVKFDGTIGMVPLAAYNGQHIALAAARNRVAVTWTTAYQLAAGNSSGGWALLECQ